MKSISDHGENDGIEFNLDVSDLAVAKFTRLVTEIHRAELNDREKAQQMAQNERDIAREMGWTE